MVMMECDPARPRSGHPLEKKQYKKLVKVMKSVEKDLRAKLSPIPTKFVVLSNAGLANGATTSAILAALPETCQTSSHLSSNDTNISLPCQPILLPDKHYAFVRCATTEIAQEVVATVSGKSCFEFLGDQPVYAGYVDRDIAGPTLCFGAFPPGLTILENRITPDDEQKWLELLGSSNQTPFGSPIEDNLEGQTISSLKNRQVEHFGFNFDYSINGVRRDQPLSDKPLPTLCSKFIEGLHQEGLLGQEHLPDQLTVNRYPPGAGIPAHCDTHSMFSSCIVIVSLGGQIVMEFRKMSNGPEQSVVSVIVPRGSVMLMADESRYGWTHSIIPRKYDLVPGPTPDCPAVAVARTERVSFTFRKVRSIDNPCDCMFPNLCDSHLTRNAPAELSLADREAGTLEQLHVHEVYDDIAKHFSGTRYSQWPRVADFLRSLPRGSLVADVGCGNGKNMRVKERPDLVFIGSDRSIGLLDICRQRKLEVAQADCLQQPLRRGAFDAAICIAVLHHLANPERRRDGLRQLVELVRPGGRVLVYVWAKEQRYTGTQSKYIKQSSGLKTLLGETSSRSNDKVSLSESAKQTVDDSESPIQQIVDNTAPTEEATAQPVAVDGVEKSMKVFPDPSIRQSAIGVCKTALVQVGDAKLNIPIHTNRSDFTAGTDILVPWTKMSEGRVKHRFYHVFREGELRSLVEQIRQDDETGSVEIEDEYYDEGNWCVVLVKVH